MARFIGDVAAVHIHDEGGLAHYKHSKLGERSRYNFDTNNENQMQEALDSLKREGWDGVSGYDQCIRYFKKLGYT